MADLFGLWWNSSEVKEPNTREYRAMLKAAELGVDGLPFLVSLITAHLDYGKTWTYTTTIKRLTDKMNMSRHRISRIVKAGIERGLLIRMINPGGYGFCFSINWEKVWEDERTTADSEGAGEGVARRGAPESIGKTSKAKYGEI